MEASSFLNINLKVITKPGGLLPPLPLTLMLIITWPGDLLLLPSRVLSQRGLETSFFPYEDLA